jgi:hypothetical protein
MRGLVVGLTVVLWSGSASAGPTAAQKCEAAKLGAAEKYSACRLGAEKKAVVKGVAPDYTKCDSKYTGAWAKAETKYTTACPTLLDPNSVKAAITDSTDDLRSHLDGGPLEGGAQPLQTGQTTAYGTGTDGDLQKGAARSYTDNGDGTITDNQTGLMWEKKDQAGGIHDYSNSYTWCKDVSPMDGICDTAGVPMDGTITTTFLATLNGSAFAGHSDWRIPNRFELETIANLQNVVPAVDTVFNTGCVASCTVTSCSCTQSDLYWSATTYQVNPSNAWGVFFDVGNVNVLIKSGTRYVRAVRGGS